MLRQNDRPNRNLEEDRTVRQLFALLRLGLGLAPQIDGSDIPAADDWAAVYGSASEQGVSAMTWDAVQEAIRSGAIAPDRMPARALKLQWAVNVQQLERRYAAQERQIASLARFYHRHGIPMMLLKGHGLGLCYPEPAHRPCGDIDIWLFGRQREADELLRREKGIAIDSGTHHHTTFVLDGTLVENHYDFLNLHYHRSNRLIEESLKRYATEATETCRAGDTDIFLPPPDFNALFLLRHAAAHFAAAEIGLRHVTDWAMFILRYGARVDWDAIEKLARQTNMHRFLHCLNTIVVDRLGVDPALLPRFEREEEQLVDRVLEEILHPRYGKRIPTKGALRVLHFKLRRWWDNRWKHRIVYREGLAVAFLMHTWGHLLKPRSIVH